MKVGWQGSDISRYRIQKCIEEALKDKKLQSRISKEAKKQYKGVFWTMAEIEAEITEFKKLLYDAAYATVMRRNKTNRFDSGDLTPDKLIGHKITNVQYSDSDKSFVTYCKVELKFHSTYVKSKSLDPIGYPNGVDNIVRLLSNGWNFESGNGSSTNHKGYPKGNWHLGLSKTVIPNVMARTKHYGYHYMTDAIQRYNNRKPKKGKLTFSYLDESYKTLYNTYDYPRILDTSLDYLDTILFKMEF